MVIKPAVPLHSAFIAATAQHRVSSCHVPDFADMHRWALQVNLKLFAPAPNRRRTVLLFVFRDRTRTPLPKLIEVWTGDLERMWDSIAKPPQFADSNLTDFFEVSWPHNGHGACAT